MADRIYVLNEGQVFEDGTHDELVRASGVYANLFQRQAQNYQYDLEISKLDIHW
jgi:ATP-binding cassette subfamily B protein